MRGAGGAAESDLGSEALADLKIMAALASRPEQQVLLALAGIASPSCTPLADPAPQQVAPDSRYEAAERCDALVIRAMLSAHEIEEVLSAGEARIAEQPAEQRRTAEGLAYETRYDREEHTAVYLHACGFFARERPELCEKLTRAMRSQPGEWADPAATLRLRTVELHTYTAGGGLFDPTHRDCGSALSMAVLLSDPAETEGGLFVTWRDARPVVHAMERGDAILFRSEKRHNVSTVMRGTRQSLVLELWEGPANTRDRYS